MNDSLIEKEKKALKYLKGLEESAGEQGYYVCCSGGKDSDAVRVLCQLAGVKCEYHHNHTTVDAPETVHYLRSIPDVQIHYPKMSMWQLIVKKGFPPTRLTRYCCEYLKERGGEGRLKVTGVRKAESPRRAEQSDLIKIVGGNLEAVKNIAEEMGCVYRVTKNGGIVMRKDDSSLHRIFEVCYNQKTNTSLNPIVDWTDDEVWEFLKHYDVEVNPLYEQGCRRIGCIGCPLAGGKQMKREFALYPKYRENYVKAFDRMIERQKQRGKFKEDGSWQTGEDVMRWWCGDDPRQITLADYEYYELLRVQDEVENQERAWIE